MGCRYTNAVARTTPYKFYACFEGDELHSWNCSDDLYQYVVASGGGGGGGGLTQTAVEYFHAGFGHFFVTAAAGEIAALDSGQFSGWTRSGQTF